MATRFSLPRWNGFLVCCLMAYTILFIIVQCNVQAQAIRLPQDVTEDDRKVAYETELIMKLLQTLDGDNDGYLEPSEFIDWYLDERPTYLETIQGLTRTTPERLDADGDGTLSSAELDNFVEEYDLSDAEQMMMFSRFDGDNNYVLDSDEIMNMRSDDQAISDLMQQSADLLSVERMSEYDLDGDGLLSMEEFETPLRREETPYSKSKKDEAEQVGQDKLCYILGQVLDTGGDPCSEDDQRKLWEMLDPNNDGKADKDELRKVEENSIEAEKKGHATSVAAGFIGEVDDKSKDRDGKLAIDGEIMKGGVLNTDLRDSITNNRIEGMILDYIKRNRDEF